jgi:UDP-N-acetylmuramoylalanine--D-glutamate ligase
METSNLLSEKKFAIYGLGLSGRSVLKFLKKTKVKKISQWDDNNKIKNKITFNIFSKTLKEADYIIVSPGIDIKKSKFKSILLKRKNKIITDLDLFFMQKIKKHKSIVITGTNGKSTTCKLIEHILKKNKKDVFLGGNIGKPILDLNIKKNSIVVIEASSFQLAYSKLIKPSYAAIINISKDHLDWHQTMTNYKQSKFKIFINQHKDDYAFLNNRKLISFFKKRKFTSKLKIIKSSSFQVLKKNITNEYLLSKPNEENVLFAISISSTLGIKKKSILKCINSFKGLPHRHEIFYKKKKVTFINDSKATSFESTKHALKSNKNIFWIVGGLRKLRDKISLRGLSQNIIKAFIIGKNLNYFENQIRNKINYKISNNLKNATKHIFNELIKSKKNESIVLLSPASASYDQFNNFVERGNEFKKLVKKYAKKHF